MSENSRPIFAEAGTCRSRMLFQKRSWTRSLREQPALQQSMQELQGNTGQRLLW